jgi:hypothetical protein
MQICAWSYKMSEKQKGYNLLVTLTVVALPSGLEPETL